LQSTQAFLQSLLLLSSVSSIFWLLAKLSGAMMFLLHALLLDELGSLLAVFYNIILAVVFSAIIFLAAFMDAAPGSLLWREMGGFVFLYIALGAVYADRPTRQVNAYGWPGYAAGLAAYLLFAMKPLLLKRPELVAFYRLTEDLGTGWLGWLLTAVMVAGISLRLLRRGLRELFFLLSPMLWFFGVIRHPPIRVRVRNDADD